MNNAINQLDLNDICRKFLPRTAEYTFFSNAMDLMDHILDYKAGLNNFTRVKIIQSCITD